MLGPAATTGRTDATGLRLPAGGSVTSTVVFGTGFHTWATWAPVAAQTIVHVVPASLLVTSATRVQLLFDGYHAGTYILDSCSISKVAGSGDAWDSASDLTQVFFSGGSESATVPEDGVLLSDPVDYTLDDTVNLMVTCEVRQGTATQIPVNQGVTGYQMYYKASTAEAQTQNRSSGYSTASANNVAGLAAIISL